MEELYTKMKEYLKMDTEISYQEFAEYYEKVMKYLQSDFQKMDKDENIKAKFILSIVSNNAATRAKRKDSEMKKYKKHQEKCAFWEKAIDYHLTNEGMSKQEIDEAVGKLSEEDGE